KGNPPAKAVRSEVEFSHRGVLQDEAVKIHGQSDHGSAQAGGSRLGGSGVVQGAGHQHGNLLQVALEVRRHGCADDGAYEGAGGGERPPAQDVRRGEAQGRNRAGGARKKVVRPSRRREMAQHAVKVRGVSVRLACEAFKVSLTCYRYVAKNNTENDEVADWLLRLTDNHRSWGFGLCFLYLRNVKGFGWNHKRVYRIYRQLELNLRIKPRKRLVRQAPQPLMVPSAVNQVWSMDFMHDQLVDGRSIRLLNVIDDFNREALG